MKIFSGKVISRKMEKTAKVSVERMVVHRLYRKRFKRTKNYLVHDELGSQIGDIVKFVACKPISKFKKWKIIKIIGKKEETDKTVSVNPKIKVTVKKKG